MPEVVKFKDAASFSLALRTAGKTLPSAVISVLQRRVLLRSLGSIVKRTPVDTGRARGNWQAGEGFELPINDAVDKTGAGTVRIGNNAIAKLQPFTRAYIFNNLPYIEVLELGGYPRPKDKPFKIPKYKFVTSTGPDGEQIRVRRKLTSKARAKLYLAFRSKVTEGGFSKKAPRGMVGITFEDEKLNLAAEVAAVAEKSISDLVIEARPDAGGGA